MSETVTRYREWTVNDPAFPSDMREASDGDWVRYADYAALAQQLADVAYLEEWRAADLRRYVYSVAGGDAVRWIAVDPLTPTDVIAESVPALGALLRQREGGR